MTARPDTSIAHCVAAQATLDATLTRLLEEGADVSAPSALPGWSVGHVLTHLARNADALHSMALGAAVGEQRLMYASPEARDAAIAEGSSRSMPDIVADLRTATSALEAAWREIPDAAWSGSGITRMGPTPIAVFPGMRWREVEVHHADLALGWFSEADWSEAFVTTDLRNELANRSKDASFALPAEVASALPWQQLAWLYGRPTGLAVPSPRWV